MEEVLKQITQVLQNLHQNQGNTNTMDLRGIQLQKFDEGNETFESYVQRLENYLELRNLTEDTSENDKRKVQILISCLGPKHYQILSNLTAPDLPKTKKYEDLVNLLRSHISPKPSEIAEQHKFTMRVQHEGESIAHFHSELKKLTTNCNFVCENCKQPTVNTHLRSQFIRGVRDSEIRERLLQQNKLTFEEALKVAISIEASKQESREIQRPIMAVNYVNKEKKKFTNKSGNQKNTGNLKEKKCFRCGKENHIAKDCKAENLKCKHCGRKGHVAIVCFQQAKKIKQLKEEDEEEEEEENEEKNELEEYTINSIKKLDTTHCNKYMKYNKLFEPTLGKIPNTKCNLNLKKETKPTFIRPRPVPYALKERIEAEIDRLEKLEIIEKTTYSEWGSPIVPVVKPSGEIRLCADYKATINKNLEDDNYPIPRIDDLFSKLGGGKYFCTLDINQAYLHMEVTEESSKIQTITTHKGNYLVKRLMFGTKIAPNVWQRFMDQVLIELEGVSCFFDDIVVQGATYSELLQRLENVFSRLEKNDLHLKRNKCQFLLKSITYLGHKIDENGLHPLEDKIKAIVNCPRPNNVDECEESFRTLKEEITSPKVLIPYKPKLKLVLATDASPTGLGAVISHILPTGEEKPVAFASRSLSKAERNYSQIDKEATAIVWGLKKFFHYCYGRKITLVTDHKPLTRILHPEKILPATSAIRLLDYASYMAGFKYDIIYRNTKDHGNADFLSRFSTTDETEITKLSEESVFYINQLQMLPVTREEIRRETRKDPEITKLIISLENGDEDQNLTKFTLEDGCLFNGMRVVIPKTLQKRILEELHTAHTGIVKMKALARSYVWWKKIDEDIETLTKECRQCCLTKNNPKAITKYHTWEYPKSPWQRVHIDYAGPFQEHYFLIIVDAYTKYLEVFPTKSMTTEITIKKLRETFSRFGLPITLVSDNATNFKSQDFKEFTQTNGIIHRFSAPYHPSTNGQAERYVQTVKKKLKAMASEPGNIHLKLCKLLMQFRKTPSAATNQSPAELLLKGNFRTRIDLVRREIGTENKKQENLKIRDFQQGDQVLARFYNNPETKWKTGRIINKEGNLHYEVEVEGAIHRRHVDQLMSTKFRGPNEKIPEIIEIPEGDKEAEDSDKTTTPETIRTEEREKEPEEIKEESGHQKTIPKKETKKTGEESTATEGLRRSTRIRKPPQKLDL
nr:uncharacterized protein K02A2.6-like [Onthophagus taurus]